MPNSYKEKCQSLAFLNQDDTVEYTAEKWWLWWTSNKGRVLQSYEQFPSSVPTLGVLLKFTFVYNAASQMTTTELISESKLIEEMHVNTSARHQKCWKTVERTRSVSVSQNGSAGPFFFTQLTLRVFPVQPSNSLHREQHGHTQKRQLPLGERYISIRFIIILYCYVKLLLRNKCQDCCEMIKDILGQTICVVWFRELILNAANLDFEWYQLLQTLRNCNKVS